MPPDELAEPGVTPEQELQLRRLLAAARHDEAVPDDLAVRLARVLEQLGEETPHRLDPVDPGETVDAPNAPDARVADLSARRRRQGGTVLLVAAAAVLVAGIGIGAAHLGGAGDSTPASTASTDSGTTDSTEQQPRVDNLSGQGPAVPGAPGPQDAAPTATATPPTPAPARLAELTARLGGPVRLHTATFGHQVEQVGRKVRSAVTDSTPTHAEPTRPGAVCSRGSFGRGALVGVVYRGAPAVLAYRPVVGSTQVVDLLACGSAQVLRSVTLPVS